MALTFRLWDREHPNAWRLFADMAKLEFTEEQAMEFLKDGKFVIAVRDGLPVGYLRFNVTFEDHHRVLNIGTPFVWKGHTQGDIEYDMIAYVLRYAHTRKIPFVEFTYHSERMKQLMKQWRPGKYPRGRFSPPMEQEFRKPHRFESLGLSGYKQRFVMKGVWHKPPPQRPR